MNAPRILLIDDDPFVTEIVAVYLRQCGWYELLEENNSLSAAAVARAFHPDLVILDVDMPGKDGGQVATEFRNDPLLKDATLIFMSGLISAKEKGVRNGAVFLPKPFPLAALNQVVEIVLAGRQSAGKRSSIDRDDPSIEMHSAAASQNCLPSSPMRTRRSGMTRVTSQFTVL